MAKTSAIWKHAAHIIYILSSPNCKTRAIPKNLYLNKKNIEEFSEKKVKRMGH